MAEFHITISGVAEDALVDDFVMKKAKKLVKDLNAGNATVDAAFVTSGHFMGGSKSVLEMTEITEIPEEIAEND